MVNIGIETAKMGITTLEPVMKAQLTVLKKLPGFKWRAEMILKAMVDDLLDTSPGDRELNTTYVETDAEKNVIRLVDRTGDTCHGRTARKPGLPFVSGRHHWCNSSGNRICPCSGRNHVHGLW